MKKILNWLLVTIITTYGASQLTSCSNDDEPLEPQEYAGLPHSAAMASEILPGKTILEALNTDLVCDAINTAMRELFLQIVYGRTQSAFSEGGLPIGAVLIFG